MFPKHRRKAGCAPLGSEYVSLNLAQGDGTFRQRAVGVKNRVVGIFPALLDQAIFGMTRLFHKAVPVTIATIVDPR